jgi:Hint domain
VGVYEVTPETNSPYEPRYSATFCAFPAFRQVGRAALAAAVAHFSALERLLAQCVFVPSGFQHHDVELLPRWHDAQRYLYLDFSDCEAAVSTLSFITAPTDGRLDKHNPICYKNNGHYFINVVSMADDPRDDDRQRAERRAFLEQCGRFAAVTAPVVTLMLTVSDKAAASSTPSSTTAPTTFKTTSTITSSTTTTTPTPTPSATPTPTPTPTGTPPCFRAGTLILTTRGEVPVEQLVPGDCVISPSGNSLTVKWIGWRHIDIARSQEHHRLWPIRIQQGALAEGVPKRDLFVSPDHALYLDGRLIPAGALINGATIVQHQDIKSISYYHVELEHHGILLAEGAGAESYFDTGNRRFFANAPDASMLHPVLDNPLGLGKRRGRIGGALAAIAATRDYRRHAAAPFADSGRAVAKVRRALVARAQELGYTITGDPDLVLMADRQLIRPSLIDNRTVSFAVPAGAKRLRLLSRSAVPAAIADRGGDQRRLGVAIARVTFKADGASREVRPHDASLHVGFYAPERRLWHTWRWTDGAAELPHQPTPDPITVEVRICGTVKYWLAPVLPDPQVRTA